MKKTINRKIFFIIITAIAISGFIIICTLAQSLRHTKIQTKFTAHVPEVTQPEYIIQEYSGQIGIFKGLSDKPYRIIEYDVSLLSEYDRQQISEGIIIESDEELRQFIEDISG